MAIRCASSSLGTGQFVEDAVLWRRIGRVKDARLPVERPNERSA
jgi:hypothetical protein